MEFNVIDEDNIFKLGNILSVFKLPECDKDIVLFSVSTFEGEDNTLNIAYLNKDNDGNDYIEEIKEKDIFGKAMLVVKDIVGTINE